MGLFCNFCHQISGLVLLMGFFWGVEVWFLFLSGFWESVVAACCLIGNFSGALIDVTTGDSSKNVFMGIKS